MAGPDSRISRALAALAVLACLFAAACATGGSERNPAAGGVYKVGQPYQVDGNWYYPQEDPLYDETGIASWYGKEFHGRRTANGEVFDAKLVTAAHKTLPMPTNVRITNLENGRQVVARVNDRGPFKASRLIDVSERAADLLGFKAKGMARDVFSARSVKDAFLYVFGPPGWSPDGSRKTSASIKARWRAARVPAQ